MSNTILIPESGSTKKDVYVATIEIAYTVEKSESPEDFISELMRPLEHDGVIIDWRHAPIFKSHRIKYAHVDLKGVAEGEIFRHIK